MILSNPISTSAKMDSYISLGGLMHEKHFTQLAFMMVHICFLKMTIKQMNGEEARMASQVQG